MTTIERIEKEAEEHAFCCELTGDDAVTGILCFTAGAISERNKVVDEAIQALSEHTYFNIFGEYATREIKKKLESLKITP